MRYQRLHRCSRRRGSDIDVPASGWGGWRVPRPIRLVGCDLQISYVV